MKKQLAAVVTGAIVIVGGGVAVVLLPSLQPAQRVVNQRADEVSEQARRELAKYQVDLQPDADAAELTGEPLDTERINALVERDSRTAEEALKDESGRLNNLLGGVQQRIRELDGRLSELEPGEPPPAPESLRLGGNVQTAVRQMSAGVDWRDQSKAKNEKLLAQSVQTARESTTVSEGGATGSENLHANRMRGVTLYQDALDAERRALTLRESASSALGDLAATATEIADARDAAESKAADNVGQQIDDLKQVVAKHEKQRDDLRNQVADLEKTIASQQKQIDEQLAKADAARSKMDELESQGIDYAKSDSVEHFRDTYQQYATEYREASRQAAALQHGTIDHARIDQTGGYLKGKFIPTPPSAQIEYVRGLDEYQRELEALERQVDAQEQIIADTQDQLKQLQSLKEYYESSQAGAAKRLEDLRSKASQQLARFNELREKLAGAEDEALRRFRDAANAFKAAERVALARVTNAPTLPPQQEELSPVKLISGDRWMAAQARCQAADAQVNAAMVLFERYDFLGRVANTVGMIQQSASAAGIDLAVIREQRETARKDGEALVDQALNALESAGRDLKNHWTVAATAAAADYVLALFGNPDMVAIARANYQNVVQGRENDPLVAEFVERLNQLRNR